MNANEIAATAVVDHTHRVGYRATITGPGGSGASGYGNTADAARADLAAVIAFNLEHNGRAIA